MAINNAKHIVSEIDGIRCTIVETGATMERSAFLNDLLSANNMEVKEMLETSDTHDAEPRYTVAVTDILFNPVFAVYERQLKTREGSFVTPGYWNQECTDCEKMYWKRRKKTKKQQ